MFVFTLTSSVRAQEHARYTDTVPRYTDTIPERAISFVMISFLGTYGFPKLTVGQSDSYSLHDLLFIALIFQSLLKAKADLLGVKNALASILGKYF